MTTDPAPILISLCLICCGQILSKSNFCTAASVSHLNYNSDCVITLLQRFQWILISFSGPSPPGCWVGLRVYGNIDPFGSRGVPGVSSLVYLPPYPTQVSFTMCTMMHKGLRNKIQALVFSPLGIILCPHSSRYLKHSLNTSVSCNSYLSSKTPFNRFSAFWLRSSVVSSKTPFKNHLF